MSIASAGCVLWLERLQPVFGCVAAVSLAYQTWLVWRRPAHRRTRSMIVILGGSLIVSGAGLSTWIALSLRYR